MNVAGEAIDGALPSMPSVKAHFRSLPYTDIPRAVEIIRSSRASLAAKAALQFVILTACRSGEARFAQWNEIDLDARLWTIPASRHETGTRTSTAVKRSSHCRIEKHAGTTG